MNYPNLEKLIDIIKILRSENGCKWDREQTHSSLRTNLLEETYEALDAIEANDMKHLKEELGDVLLQVILHSQIAAEEGDFAIDDVALTIAEKLIRRHPHVFSDTKVNSVEDILKNWEEIKQQEKPHRKSVMDGVSRSQPALMKALKISKKAVKVGFEWQNIEQLFECVNSEIKEFKEAETQQDKEEELGDLLFAIVNLARWEKIDPEIALLKANEKFVSRFKKMEENATKPLEEYSFSEYNDLWQKIKKL